MKVNTRCLDEIKNDAAEVDADDWKVISLFEKGWPKKQYVKRLWSKQKIQMSIAPKAPQNIILY